MSLRTLSLPLLLCPWLAQPAAQAQGLTRADLEQALAPILKSEGIPGAVIGVVVGEDLIVSEAFGWAALESQEPMTVDRLFQVGSLTKPFAATLFGLLAAEGRLSWDDTLGTSPFREHVPEDLADLTARQLATHTAGLPRNPTNRRDLPNSPAVMLPYSIEELYTGLQRTSLEHEPGSRWSYSNLGYALLGHWTESRTEEGFAELLEKRILGPLGMRSSGIHPTEEERARFAACYWPDEAEPVARDPWEFGEVAAFGGLYSSLEDLARFVAAQYDQGAQALLSPNLRDVLHTAVIEIDPERGRAMAPGWFVERVPGIGSMLGHGGEVDGHSATLAVLPKQRAGLIVLANRGGRSAERLIAALLPVALPKILQPRAPHGD